mgnify:CR=1 FL=1
MEIFAFLKLTRGRLAILVLVSLAGAGAGVAYMMREPQTWDFTARIRVADVFAPGAPSYEVSGYNSMVLDALKDDTVLAAIAEDSKADIDLVNAMEVSLPSEGSPVIVTVEAADKAIGTAVVANAGRLALEDVAKRKLTIAEAAAAKSGPAFDAHQKELDDFQARTGYGYGIPETIKQLVGVEIPALETALATADAASKPDITARLDSARQQAEALQPLLAEASAIYRRIDTAYSEDVDAQKDLAQAQAWVQQAGDPGEALVIDNPVLRSRVPVLARGAVGGAALGGLLAGLLLFLTRRRTTEPGSGGDTDKRRAARTFWAFGSPPSRAVDAEAPLGGPAGDPSECIDAPLATAEGGSQRSVAVDPGGRVARFPNRLA